MTGPGLPARAGRRRDTGHWRTRDIDAGAAGASADGAPAGPAGQMETR